MKRYIFLDIHGVVDIPNDRDAVDKDVPVFFDENCLYWLGQLLKNTDSELVIISSLRKKTLEETKSFLQSHGFPFVDKIVGQTIRGYEHIELGFPMSIPRGVEVKHWIDNHIHRDHGQGPFQKKVVNTDYQYVILDDSNDYLMEQDGNLVLCFKRQGLGWKEHAKAMDIFNRC